MLQKKILFCFVFRPLWREKEGGSHGNSTSVYYDYTSVKMGKGISDNRYIFRNDS